jgi:hypothetical protein
MEQGDPGAAEKLLPLVYEALRKLAAQMLAREAPGQTLQATALVHEAYLRLARPASGSEDGAADEHWSGRRHFFAAAAEAMRRILINRARDRGRVKRGGDWRRLRLDQLDLSVADPPAEFRPSTREGLTQDVSRERSDDVELGRDRRALAHAPEPRSDRGRRPEVNTEHVARANHPWEIRDVRETEGGTGEVRHRLQHRVERRESVGQRLRGTVLATPQRVVRSLQVAEAEDE